MNISNLSLIEAFVTVANTKSFSKASVKLNQSLPNISRKVQQLESELGVRLFHRTTRSVSLTSDGEIFLAGAESILKDLTSLQSAFTEANELSGEIRITCLPSISMRWLPEVLLSFQKKHPKVHFTVESSDRIFDLVAERIDVAIRVQTPKAPDLVFRKLAPNKLVLVASPQYLKKYGTPKTVDELRTHPLLMISPFAKVKFVSEKVQLSKLVGPQSLKSENGIFLTEMALSGAGIAVRSLWDVAKFIADKSLIRILPNSELETFGDLYLVSTTKGFLNRRTTAFIEHAQTSLTSLIREKRRT